MSNEKKAGETKTININSQLKLSEAPLYTGIDGYIADYMNTPKELYIKYFSDDIERIKKLDKGDWIDLRAAEDVEIEEGTQAMIPLGVAMELPAGYEAIVAPRSSTFKNYGIIQTNSIGIIDNSYNGDNDQWYISVFCLEGRSTKYGKFSKIFGKRKRFTKINKGDRIAQFRILGNMPKLFIKEVDTLGDNDRGGFGSTGVE